MLPAGPPKGLWTPPYPTSGSWALPDPKPVGLASRTAIPSELLLVYVPALDEAATCLAMAGEVL